MTDTEEIKPDAIEVIPARYQPQHQQPQSPYQFQTPPPTQSLALTSQQQISALVRQYLDNQQIKPISKKLYVSMLEKYFRWLSERKLILAQAQRADLLKFREYLINDSGLNMSSASTCITVVRSFYKYLDDNDICRNLASGLKPPKTKKGFKKMGLTREQVTDLLEWSQKNQCSRDFAICNLLALTGVRLIEVTRADVGDISQKYGERVLNVQGKGRDEKDDFVVMIDECFFPIQKYLQERKAYRPQDPLFVSTSNINLGGRLSTRTIETIVRAALDAIGLGGLKEYTPHSLRHSCAQNILDAGGSTENAQNVLRHVDPATTQLYLNATKEKRRIMDAPERRLGGWFKRAE